MNVNDHEQPLVLSVTILEETVNTVWRQEEKKRLWTLHADKRRRRDCGHCMETRGDGETVDSAWIRDEIERLWTLYGD